MLPIWFNLSCITRICNFKEIISPHNIVLSCRIWLHRFKDHAKIGVDKLIGLNVSEFSAYPLYNAILKNKSPKIVKLLQNKYATGKFYMWSKLKRGYKGQMNVYNISLEACNSVCYVVNCDWK